MATCERRIKLEPPTTEGRSGDLKTAAGHVHKALRDREGVIAIAGKPERWMLAR